MEDQDFDLENMVFFEEDLHEVNSTPEEVVTEDPVENIEEDPETPEVLEESEETETLEVNEDSEVEEENEAPESEEPIDDIQLQLQRQFDFMSSQGLMNTPEGFEFDGTIEKFQEAIDYSKENQKNQAIMEVWNALPKDFQVVLEYGLNGGKDIQEVQQYLNTEVSLDSIDLEDPSSQKRVVREHLKKTTKYSEVKIDKYIKLLEQSNTLEAEAEDAVAELKEIGKEERALFVEKEKETQKQYQQQLQQAYEQFSDTVTNKIEASDSRKKQIINAIWQVGKYGETEQTYFDHIDSQVKNNPEHLAQLINIYLDYDPSKGFGAGKGGTRKAKSAVVKDFRDQVTNLLSGAGSVQKSNATSQPKTNDFNLEHFLKQN